MAAEDDRAAPAPKHVEVMGAAESLLWFVLAVFGFLACWALWCGTVAVFRLLSTLVR